MLTKIQKPTSIEDQHFQEFADVIKRELGIKMPEAKATMLYSRLQRRLRILEIDTIEAYQERLFNSPHSQEEFIHFVDAVTTNKTDFFREAAHFTYLTEKAIPELDRYPRGPFNFKLWSAGCSTGEEPYTLAMVLSEFALKRERFTFSIFGTDISSRVLESARQAIYAEERIEPVAPLLRKKYLSRSRDPSKKLIRIAPQLRAHVSFARLNFMDDHYALQEQFDVIFFRNVLIYFDRPTQEAVVNKLCRNLKPGGYLFIGHSESLTGLEIPLKLIASSVFKKLG